MVAAMMKEERRDAVELRNEYGISSDNFRTWQISTNRLVNNSHSLLTRELPVHTHKTFCEGERFNCLFPESVSYRVSRTIVQLKLTMTD